jgi:hypothetical protein
MLSMRLEEEMILIGRKMTERRQIILLRTCYDCIVEILKQGVTPNGVAFLFCSCCNSSLEVMDWWFFHCNLDINKVMR